MSENKIYTSGGKQGDGYATPVVVLEDLMKRDSFTSPEVASLTSAKVSSLNSADFEDGKVYQSGAKADWHFKETNTINPSIILGKNPATR